MTAARSTPGRGPAYPVAGALPWSVAKIGARGLRFALRDFAGSGLGACYRVEYAERIVRAVNSHAELLAALRDLREACTDAYKSGRISAEPFVRAGNVIARAEGVKP